MSEPDRTGSAEAATPSEPDGLDATDVIKERRLIEEAQRDMCAAFPALGAEHVGVVVACLWAEYDGARIRDFIPVLVRKQAREELRDQLHTEASASTAHWGNGAWAWAANGALSQPS